MTRTPVRGKEHPKHRILQRREHQVLRVTRTRSTLQPIPATHLTDGIPLKPEEHHCHRTQSTQRAAYPVTRVKVTKQKRIMHALLQTRTLLLSMAMREQRVRQAKRLLMLRLMATYLRLPVVSIRLTDGSQPRPAARK